MSKQTPTPWALNHFHTPKIAISTQESDQVLDEDICICLSESDALRIVTCVNAMEGLTNEEVEGMRELIKEAHIAFIEIGIHKKIDYFKVGGLIAQTEQYIKP